jgi:hypothetical protein
LRKSRTKKNLKIEKIGAEQKLNKKLEKPNFLFLNFYFATKKLRPVNLKIFSIERTQIEIQKNN